MRIVSIFLATLVLIFSLSACQIVNEEELAAIREEGYQQGKESAERDSASALSAQYDAGHEEGYQAGYQKGREDGLKEAAQKAKADKAKDQHSSIFQREQHNHQSGDADRHSICDRYWVQIPSVWLPVPPGELPRADAFAGQGAGLYGLFRLQPTGIKRFLFFAKNKAWPIGMPYFLHYSTGSKLSRFVS